MYFKDKENTNIDSEFKENIIKFDFNKLKLPLMIFGVILLIIMILIFVQKFNKKENITYYINILGNENYSIYQNSDYIEPGYEAYDSKGNDLTNEVEIIGIVDTKTIGEYELTYNIQDIFVTRKVSVIEKPKGATYIYLKGNSVIYLEKNQNYQEPGYIVIDTVDSNLTEKVKITNNLDETKAGTYKIIYSVINSNGIETNITRTVIVMDSEINLSLNTYEYTNSKVNINVYVVDNYFDYIILPNNEKINQNTYTYSVSENGTYKFTTVNKKGIKKEASVTVSNIDKIAPTGSCIVDHDEEGSFITLNIKDNNGINKYIYNGNNYNTNKIRLKEYIKEAKIDAYDKVGNKSTFNCKVLPIKETLLVDTSHYSNIKKLNYVSITSVNVTDAGCKIVYGGDAIPVERIRVHEAISQNFKGIIKNVCAYVNETEWLKYLQHHGAYTAKVGGYHGMGVAIDLNDQWKYTAENGKTYQPYRGQGISTWNRYNKFICEVCDGKEDCKYNVNYIIFKRYFEGNGWCWGGNWDEGGFDPMHFELRKENCLTHKKAKITC